MVSLIFDVGAATYNHIKGDHKKAIGHWKDAGYDTFAVLVPFLPASLSKVRYVDDATELAGDVAKSKVKNLDGSKGKQDHQQKVQELNSKALGEANNDETVLIEKKIRIEGSNRRPDVQIIDKDNRTRKIFEAERHPESKRNRMREEEYKRLSIEYETHSLK